MATTQQATKPAAISAGSPQGEARDDGDCSAEPRQPGPRDEGKDHLVQPVVLNTALHQRLLLTGGVKPSSIESAMRALMEIRRRKAAGLPK